MATTASEQSRGLDTEVGHLLLVTVDDGHAVDFDLGILALLDFQLLLFRHGLPNLGLLLEVGVNLAEVAFGQVVDDLSLRCRHDLSPILHEIGVELFHRDVFVINHPAVEGSHFFGICAQFHLLNSNTFGDNMRINLASVEEFNMAWERNVRRGEERSHVRERVPFDAFRLLVLLPPFPDLFDLFLLLAALLRRDDLFLLHLRRAFRLRRGLLLLNFFLNKKLQAGIP